MDWYLFTFSRLLPLLIYLIPLINGASSKFDNAIVGLPVISCERDQIRVEVETEKPFGGKIFVKGEFKNKKCIRSYIDGRHVTVNPVNERESSSEQRWQTARAFEGTSPPLRGREPVGAGFNTKEKGKWAERGSATGGLNPPIAASQMHTGVDSEENESAKKIEEHTTIDPSLLSSNQWRGVGGARQPDPRQPITAIFNGNQETTGKREGEPGGSEGSAGAGGASLKVYPSKENSRWKDGGSMIVSDGMRYPGPQGFTQQNCPLTCEPCSCEPRSEERRRRETNRIELIVPLGACNAKRDRTLNPPSMVTSFVAVVSFHDSFITKLDRAYHIQCAYTETTMPVHTELNVSMAAPSDLSNDIPSPVCRHVIAGADGQPRHNVRVGDLVRHTWKCDSPVEEMFTMLVHDCYVEDGAGERHRVVDEYGCTMDKYVLPTPDYSKEDLSATVEAFMFKFPDKSSVDFQCAIKICSKLDDDCHIVTPPACSTARRRRSTDVSPHSLNDSMTIHSNTLTVLDSEGVDGDEVLPLALVSPPPPSWSSDLCLSVAAFGAVISATTFLSTLSLAAILAHFYIKNSRY